MSDWAKQFYNSATWRKMRDYIRARDNGLCQICGAPGEEVHHIKHLTPDNLSNPDITLNPDNLILLCKACHSAEHLRSIGLTRLNRMRSWDPIEAKPDGSLGKAGRVYIVWGAPASGKTTYVKQHKGAWDLVVDLDYLKRALMLDGDPMPDTLPWAQAMRDTLYQAIADRRYYFDQAWVIAGLPKLAERRQLRQRLDAELIHIDTDIDTCLAHAKYDDSRKDKLAQEKIIKKYFEELQE